jgi:hypothetical protein
LIASLGVERYRADWTNNRHRARRLLSEFIGTFGLLYAPTAVLGGLLGISAMMVLRVAGDNGHSRCPLSPLVASAGI